MADGISGRLRLTRLRTLGRGASGAVVSLFAAEGGEDEQSSLLAVKSAGAASSQALLRREEGILASLCSPYVLPCLGSRAAADAGEYQLFLEFAPGGSLADEVERNGGSLEEGAVRAYAADVARGLAYLHGKSMVHGDVKGRNVVIGADGWAKLADFGCARAVDSAGPIIGGTPAFMAPEVARGEEQGPAADVWALGCTVIEMATGRAPWSGVDDVIALVHLIGYTDAVPEWPDRLSAEAKDFLDKCLRRRAGERWTAAQLIEHPFLAFAGCGGDVEARWVSPKSTLDAAMWESDAEEEEDSVSDFTSEEEDKVFTAERMKALAASYWVLPDWELDDGWIDVLSRQSELPVAAAAETPAELSCSEVPNSPVAIMTEETTSDGCSWDDEALESEIGVEEARTVCAAVAPPDEAAYDCDADLWEEGLLLEAETGAEASDAGVRVGDELVVHNVGVANEEDRQQSDVYWDSIISDHQIVVSVDSCDDEGIVNSLAMPGFIYLCFSSVPPPSFCHLFTRSRISVDNAAKCSHRSEHFVSKSHELDRMLSRYSSSNYKHVDEAPFQQTVGAKRAGSSVGGHENDQGVSSAAMVAFRQLRNQVLNHNPSAPCTRSSDSKQRQRQRKERLP